MISSIKGIHIGIASIADREEILLSDDQADRLGKATAKVLSFHVATAMTPYQLALGELIGCALSVYVPMVVAIRATPRAAPQPPINEAVQPKPSPANPAPQPGRPNLVNIPGVGPVDTFDDVRAPGR